MKLKWLLLAAMTSYAFGQAVRYDNNATQAASNVPPGSAAPVYTVPNAKVTVCGYPAVPESGSVCTNTVTVYSDESATHPLDSPIIADPLGRFGFWAIPGMYSYSIQTQGGSYVGTWTLSLISPPSPVGPGEVYPPIGADLSAYINSNCEDFCHVYLGAGAYTWSSGVSKSNITIEGTGQAQYPSDPTDLTGFIANTGTIIKGNVSIIGSNITLKNLSIDNGTNYGTCPGSGGADSNALLVWGDSAGNPKDTALIENVSTIACSGGVHSILAIQNHLTLRNVTTRGGIYGWVVFGNDINVEDTHSSYHPTSGWIVKSTDFSPGIATSMVNISNSFVEHSGAPNIFGLGAPVSAINIRGLNIQNGVGLLINASSNSGGTGSVSRLTIDGYQLAANSLSSEGLQLSGNISQAFLSHLMINQATDNGITIDSGVGEVHIANSFINSSNRGISTEAALTFIDGGMSFGTAASPLNDYPIYSTAGTVSVYGSIAAFTNQGEFVSPGATLKGFTPTKGGDTKISGFLRPAAIGPITIQSPAGTVHDFNVVGSGGTNSFLVEDTGAISWANGVPIGSSSLVPQVATTPPTAGHAACIKSSGPPTIVGYCSTTVDASGGCTCN